MQRLSQIRKSRKDGSILRDQRSIQLLCCGNELTFLHQPNGSGTLQEITAEHIAKLAAPQRRCRPSRSALSSC